MLSKIRFALSPIQWFIIKKLFLKYQRFYFYFTYIRLNLQMHCEIVMEKRNFWNIESIAKPVLFLLGTSKNSQSHKYQEKTFFTDCVSRLSQNKRSLTNYHWRADFSSMLRRHQAKLPTHDVVNNFFSKSGKSHETFHLSQRKLKKEQHKIQQQKEKFSSSKSSKTTFLQGCQKWVKENANDFEKVIWFYNNSFALPKGKIF